MAGHQAFVLEAGGDLLSGELEVGGGLLGGVPRGLLAVGQSRGLQRGQEGRLAVGDVLLEEREEGRGSGCGCGSGDG